EAGPGMVFGRVFKRVLPHQRFNVGNVVAILGFAIKSHGCSLDGLPSASRSLQPDGGRKPAWARWAKDECRVRRTGPGYYCLRPKPVAQGCQSVRECLCGAVFSRRKFL